MSKQINHIYEFGEFQLQTAERLLLREGRPISLTPKAFETLLILVQSSGHVVEKDDLMRAVWAEAFVEEANLARNIWTLRNLNQPDPVTKLLPYPNFGTIEWADQDGSSTYNGLELAVERRFAHPFGFRVAYTLSKATDNSGEHLFTGGSPSFSQDARNRDAWLGPADADTRHRVAANWILDLPFQFNFSGIVTARTGRPFTVTQSSNSVGNLMTGLPNRIGDGEGAKTVDSWFDKTAFQAVTSGTFGNSGRNILRGPGLFNTDIAVQRRFAITGQTAIELRWEVFNLFNATELGLPETNISNAAVATITRLAGDARVMQFALRLVF